MNKLWFVDLKKAYDSVNKEAFWFVIVQQGILNKLVGLLVDLHWGTHTTVKAFGWVSDV
jgi:hypothetical protein